MKTVVISLVMLATASAFANEAADEQANRSAFQSVATRAEVKADYLSARQSGTLPVTSEAASLHVPAVGNGVHTRDEARYEARQAARQRVVHELL